MIRKFLDDCFFVFASSKAKVAELSIPKLSVSISRASGMLLATMQTWIRTKFALMTLRQGMRQVNDVSFQVSLAHAFYSGSHVSGSTCLIRMNVDASPTDTSNEQGIDHAPASNASTSNITLP